MKYPRYLTALMALTLSATAMADAIYTAQGVIPLPAQGTMQIYSENATGEKQKTIVDQNGNLKVVDKPVEQKPETPATSPQGQSIPMQQVQQQSTQLQPNQVQPPQQMQPQQMQPTQQMQTQKMQPQQIPQQMQQPQSGNQPR